MQSREVNATLNVVTSKYIDLKSISNAVVDKLVGFQSRVIGNNGPFIQEVSYEEPKEFYEELPNLYRCVIEFSVYFEG